MGIETCICEDQPAADDSSTTKEQSDKSDEKDAGVPSTFNGVSGF